MAEPYANAEVDASTTETECRARLFTKPDDVVAMRRLGWLCGQSGRMEEGRDLLERALALRPQSVDLLVTAAALAANAGDSEAAEDGYRKALALEPNSPAGQSGLGRLAAEREQWQTAEQYFRAALKAAPQDINALLGLGQTRLAQGDAQQAAHWFLRAAQLYPQHPLALTHYAQSMLALGDVQAAARPLIRALELDPGLLLARRLLGRVELARERAVPAERAFRMVVASQPDDADAHVGLGHALRAQARYTEAIAAYDAAIAQGAGDDELVSERAVCLLQTGRADAAVEDLRTYVDAHPRCEMPRVLLASVFDQSGYADEALAFWQTASRANDDDALAHAELAQRQEAAGDFAGSAESATKSVADKRVFSALLRARVAVRGDDLVAAQRELLAINTKGLMSEAATERYRMLGVVHDHNRRYAEAVLAFREAQRMGAVPLPALTDAELITPLLRPVLSLDELETPRISAPVLLLGLPGTGVERVAAMLGDQDGVIVRHDRFGEQFDLFADPSDPRLLSPLSQPELGVLAKRYARVQQRTVAQADALVIDWIPVFDVRVLAQARRVLPGLRAICIDPPDREAAFLRWLAFGWANYHAADTLEAARWWHRAAGQLAAVDGILPVEHVRADTLLESPQHVADQLATFLDLSQCVVGGTHSRVLQRDRRRHAAQFELAAPSAYRDVLGVALSAL